MPRVQGGRVGPDLSSAVERRSPDYIARIVDEPQTVLPGTAMPRTPMMPELRALVLAALIGTTPGKVPPRQPPLGTAPASAAPTPNAAGLYARYCAACHGRDGGGDGPNARYLPVRPAVHRDATLMSTRTDDRLFDAIYAGGYPLGKNGAMPGFGATLSRADILANSYVICDCSVTAQHRPGRPTGREAAARRGCDEPPARTAPEEQAASPSRRGSCDAEPGDCRIRALALVCCFARRAGACCRGGRRGRGSAESCRESPSGGPRGDACDRR